MMKTTLFCSLLLTLTAAANVRFSPKKELLIRGQSCDEIMPYAQSIFDWTTLGLDQHEYQLPECFCSSSECRVDVLSISPYFVRSYTSFGGGYTSVTAHNGPNCFNSALVASRTLSNITFSHPKEITYLLSSPLCRERQAHEALVAGDIMVVRDQTDEFFEIHAGTYVSDELSFSKYGEDRPTSYSYGINVDRAYKVYNQNCKRIQGIPKDGDECFNKRFTNYFHCRPLYSFVSDITKEQGGMPEDLREVYIKVSRLDSSISSIAVKGAPTTEKELKESQSVIRSYYRKAKKLTRSRSYSANQTSFAFMMKYRLLSLYEQNRRIAGDKGLNKIATTKLRE